MDLLEEMAEARIREAAERGEFNDLPGAGQPLDLDDDSGVPQELRAGYRLLKNAGYLPPELELRKEAMELEGLLQAAIAEEEDRQRISRRLQLVVTRLQISQERLRGEPAYLDKLQRRFPGPP